MGWSSGENNNGRPIGYAIRTVCDHPGCETVTDSGVANICGGLDGAGNAGMDDESYCGGIFCDEHLFFIPSNDENDSFMVCQACLDRQGCPDCGGEGYNPADMEECETCDSHGYAVHRWDDERGKMVVLRA